MCDVLEFEMLNDINFSFNTKIYKDGKDINARLILISIEPEAMIEDIQAYLDEGCSVLLSGDNHWDLLVEPEELHLGWGVMTEEEHTIFSKLQELYSEQLEEPQKGYAKSYSKSI